MTAANTHLHPVATAWYLRTWRDFRMETPQIHPRAELMYVLSGTCTMGAGSGTCTMGAGNGMVGTAGTHAPDAGWSQHLMRRGDFLYVDAMVPHTLVTDPNGDCRMLNIEYSWGETKSAEAMFPDQQTQIDAEDSLSSFFKIKPASLFLKDAQDVGSLMRSLVLELDGGAAAKDWLVQSLFFSLHIRIARLWTATERYRVDASGQYVDLALHWMRHHYAEDIRISDVAAAVNVHPAYLQRLFRRNCQETIVSWLGRYRVEQAKMLLMSTDLPVSDLCGYVGINSRQHFMEVFRRHAGMSPGVYRKKAAPVRYAESTSFLKDKRENDGTYL